MSARKYYHLFDLEPVPYENGFRFKVNREVIEVLTSEQVMRMSEAEIEFVYWYANILRQGQQMTFLISQTGDCLVSPNLKAVLAISQPEACRRIMAHILRGEQLALQVVIEEENA